MDRFTKLLENGSIVVDCNICDQNQRTCHPLYCRHRLIQRLAEYEDTGLEPEEIDMLQSNKMLDDQERRLLFAYESIGPIDHLRELVQAEADKRLVVLPCKVGYSVDKLFSHNEVIALWYDKPGDKDHSYLLWRGEAWRLPDKYKDQRILKFKGIIPERISEADTLNLQVTPYILTREEAQAAVKGGGN